jgi:uncharacterized protein
MANRVVHFEIEAKDSVALSKFYEKAFGWKMDIQGPEMGNYVVMTTGDDPIGINGGMFSNPAKQLNAYSCTIGVDDIEKAIADIRAAGGTVEEHNMNGEGVDMGEVIDIPGVGKYAKCVDPDGNQFTLLQPDMDGPYSPK